MAAAETIRFSLAALNLSDHQKDEPPQLPPVVPYSETLYTSRDDNDVTMTSPASAPRDIPLASNASDETQISSSISATQSSISPNSIRHSPLLKQYSPTLKSAIEIVHRHDQTPVVSDIIVLPRQSRLSKSSSQIVDLEISNIPFLSDGHHRLWTASNKSNNQETRLLPNQDNSRYPYDAVDSHFNKHYQRYQYYKRFQRWKELLLGAEFWATVPRVVNSYIQLAFNLTVVGAACFCLWSFVASLRNDVVSKLVHHAKQLSQKVAECRAEYERNRCDPEQRVPALEHLCNDWALCIEAGASGSMQTAALSAEILGQVINTFLEQLTWKSVALLIVGIVAVLICSNTLLSLTRWRFEKSASVKDVSSNSTISTLCPTSNDVHQCCTSRYGLCPYQRSKHNQSWEYSRFRDLSPHSSSLPDLSNRFNEFLCDSSDHHN